MVVSENWEWIWLWGITTVGSIYGCREHEGLCYRCGGEKRMCIVVEGMCIVVEYRR